MTTATIKIDPEFKALIPPLTDEERQQLEDNLKADGCRDALVVWSDGVLVDGHNRYEICNRLGIEYRVEEMVFDSRSDAIEWIIKNQFGRRNLPDYVRVKLALRLEAEIAARAKANQVAGGGDQKSGCQKSDKAIEAPIDTKREIAKAAHVSHDTVAKVKKIEATATPELKAKAERGEISINAAAAIATAPPEQQRTVATLDKAEILKAANKIKREQKEQKQREREQQREAAKAIVRAKPADDRIKTFNLPVADLTSQISAGSVDVIITDPPYPKEFLSVYEDLARTAAALLKPGASCIVMVGQSYLPEIIAAMSRHLRYHWMCAYMTPGGQAVQLWDRKVNTFWKPLLWFTNGEPVVKDWVGDVARSNPNDNDKASHHWGQSISGMLDVVRRFSTPGQTVLDPFCGAGTTGVACVLEGRLFIGSDINDGCAAQTLTRCSQAVGGV